MPRFLDKILYEYLIKVFLMYNTTQLWSPSNKSLAKFREKCTYLVIATIDPYLIILVIICKVWGMKVIALIW